MAKETILLIDMGANSTYVVPIISGYIAQKGILLIFVEISAQNNLIIQFYWLICSGKGVVRSGVAGEYLTERLAEQWRKKSND